MKQELKTHTDYDLELLEELQRVAGRSFAKSRTRGRRAFAFSWGAFCLGAGIVIGQRSGASAGWLPVLGCLLCCVLGVVMLGHGLFFYQVTAWTAYRAMGRNREGNDFLFQEQGILARRGTESGTHLYSACQELLETEHSIYFIMDNGQGLILNKDNVKGGTAQQLVAFLEEKCGKKTRWMGKKQR